MIKCQQNLIQAGGGSMYSEIHTSLNYFRNKEEIAHSSAIVAHYKCDTPHCTYCYSISLLSTAHKVSLSLQMRYTTLHLLLQHITAVNCRLSQSLITNAIYQTALRFQAFFFNAYFMCRFCARDFRCVRIIATNQY